MSVLRLPELDSALLIFSSALAMISFCRVISVAARSICATPSCAFDVCSMCALDKNPKIPILVINIRTTTLTLRYALSHHAARAQYLCSQTAATSLPTSRAPPMMIIGIAAEAKIATNPATL